MKAVDQEIRRYLHEVFGAEPDVLRWDPADQLPYFLQDAYEFRRAKVLESEVVLAIDRRGERRPGRDLRVQLARVGSFANLPVVYVVNALASHERRRLVEQKIPFIVPGNQLYLPMLGIDFREHFRRPLPPGGRPLSPATQAVLIAALMRKLWHDDWPPEGIATELGYGPMTSSRAARELTAAGIATPVERGRRRLLRFERPPAVIWDESRSVLKSPLRRSVWAAVPAALLAEINPLPAGQSALALNSAIGEPRWPAYAVSAASWRKAMEPDTEILPEPEPGASEWQIWNYNPRLGPDVQQTVDPLSLTLSLQDSTDERIRIALDELKEKFPWSEV